MRAAIDIGSNSVRLALSNGKTFSHITQLASGIERTGTLSPIGVQNTVSVLKEYKALCKDCAEIFAYATEAVRRATDGNSFIARVKSETGFDIIQLSAEQEAKLALLGATKPNGPITVCDLGGGSLEVISSEDGITPDYIKSLPIGVVVAKNLYGDYRKAIDELPDKISEYGLIPARSVVISGGSACNIAAAILGLSVYDKYKVSTRFTVKQLDEILPLLMSDKLAVLRPICAKRADTVAYGAIIIQALLNHIDATDFYVSDSGNLEAVIEYGICI